MGGGNDNEKIRNIEQFKGTECVAPKANKKSLKFQVSIYHLQRTLVCFGFLHRIYMSSVSIGAFSFPIKTLFHSGTSRFLILGSSVLQLSKLVKQLINKYKGQKIGRHLHWEIKENLVSETG